MQSCAGGKAQGWESLQCTIGSGQEVPCVFCEALPVSETKRNRVEKERCV